MDAAHEDAESRAKNAACLVMAPVSHAQNGEARGAKLSDDYIPLLDATRGLVAGLPQIVKEFYGIAEGYLVAYVYRIKSFECEREGGVVTATFDYLCPMSVPGFVGLWTYFFDRYGGGKEAHHQFDVGAPFLDPAELNAQINEVFDALIEVGNVLDAVGIDALDDLLNSIRNFLNQLISGIYSVGVLGAEYNVTLNVKSVCGFELWTGEVRDGDNERYCESEADPDAQACGEAMAAQQEEINRLTQIAADECERSDELNNVHQDKETILNEKEVALQNCLDTADVPAVECVDEQNERDAAFLEERAAFSDAEDQSEVCDDANTDAANASQTPEECSDFF